MDAFLNSLGLNLIYLALLGIGVIYAVIILVAGGLGDVNAPGLDVDVGTVEVGGDVGAPEAQVPALSPVTIASFVSAFGAFGLIAAELFAVSAPYSLLWALVGGLVVATIAHFAFAFFLIQPQGSSEVRLKDLAGRPAEVITSIPADSVGEIAFVAQGGRVTYTAKSAGRSPIARGTTVTIERVVGGVAVVRPHEPTASKETN